ncbi:MAG: ROK family protein [Deltaproteobacteria bacterium]|nr:ROK family protein [Deltaproteobacteria bacterium]
MATLAFDLGGTHLRAGVVDDGKITAQRKMPLLGTTPDEIAALMKNCAAELPPTEGAIGVGIAAMVSQPHGIVENAPNLGWRNVDFAGVLHEVIPERSAVLTSDLDAICLGEARNGAAKGCDHVLCVYVGTGVGAGLLLNGKIYSGARGVGSEFGHMKSTFAQDKRCGCGQNGCLESLVGGKNLLSRLRGDVAANSAFRVLEIANEDPGAVDVHLGHVDAAYKKHDDYAVSLWIEISNALGDAIANAVTLLNPQKVLLGGGVIERCPTLYQLVCDRLLQRANAVALPGLHIGLGSLGDAAGILGAAAFAQESQPSKPTSHKTF